MLLLFVPWHPNLSCVPHHVFFLPSPEKGFHSATSQMSGGDAPLKMCNGDLLLKVYWKILGAAAGGKKQFFLTLAIFLDSQKSGSELRWVRRNSAKTQKWHTKPQKITFPPLPNEIRSWCEKNLKAATHGQARGGSGVRPEPRSLGKFIVTGLGQERVTFYVSSCPQPKCQISWTEPSNPSLSSLALHGHWHW